METITVQLGDRSYPVIVGAGARHQLDSVVPSTAKRAAIVTQETVPWEVRPGVEIGVFHIGPDESFKTMSTIEGLCAAFADWGLTRADCVIGVGGGMVTDIAGFAASVYHRGMPVIHVPTTLLGQIDAAIGGKTGVNLPQGKNLVGTYWQPSAVLCDLETLTTLPPREMRCGLGELAKYRWIGERSFDDLDLQAQVAACVQIKADVVASDERESGRRALLNYGHTLGHAIEIVTDHEVAHGEGVAIGLVFAAELAFELGRIDAESVATHRRVLAGYDLPMALPSGIDEAALLPAMYRDKKALSGLTFVLLDGDGHLQVVSGVAEAPIRAALTRVRA